MGAEPQRTRRSGVLTTAAGWLAIGVLVATVAMMTVTSWRLAGEGKPLSVVDELVHSDTSFKVHNGNYPDRGELIGQPAVDSWLCHTGHSYTVWELACDDPAARPRQIPSGQFTTGYIHYPTYFVGGEVFRQAYDLVAGEETWSIDTYRRYAAVMNALGVVAAGVIAWLLGLRGASVAAAALVPVAAPAILIYSTMVNPMSIAPLCGVLVAGAGLRWMMTGRGFWWLVAATAFAAVTAVTASLAGGAFLLAILAGLLLRWRGRTFDTGWVPRWWHALVLALVLALPIVGYGVWIDARATLSDEELYGSYQVQDWKALWLGVWTELFGVKTPWQDDASLVRPELGRVAEYARAAVPGLTFLIGVVVIGGLVAAATGAFRPRLQATTEAQIEDTERRDPLSVLTLLAASTFVGLMVYPPLLRALNAYNSGVDHPIVARYSTSMAPLIVLILLLAAADRPWFGRALAVLATVSVAFWCVSVW